MTGWEGVNFKNLLQQVEKAGGNAGRLKIMWQSLERERERDIVSVSQNPHPENEFPV